MNKFVKSFLLIWFYLISITAFSQKKSVKNQRLPVEENYFFHGYNYGSEAAFNPATLFLNRAFDILQVQLNRRNIFDIDYKPNIKNVFDNLAHPIDNIEDYGWKNFLTKEVFPLNFDGKKARWVPNYTLHLIGGGMDYTALNEWFKYHNVRFRHVWSASLIMACAVINEALENKGSTGRNVDAIADMYVFDIGGMILFSFDGINRFFSKTLNLADWSLQPAFTFHDGNLHNHGQQFSAKWRLPFSRKWHVFAQYGMINQGGLSYKLKNGDMLSVGVGARTSRLVAMQEDERQNTIELGASFGIYYDRNNSLLASLTINDVEDYFCNLNIYPGVLKFGDFTTGIWSVLTRKGEFCFGFSTKYTLNIGFGFETSKWKY